MAKVGDSRTAPGVHIVDIPITKLFNKQGVRYVRIPTEDPTGSETPGPSGGNYTELPIPHSQLSAGVAAAGARGKYHLLKLLAQLACVGCFVAGRRCGPTLLIAFIVYLYVNGILALGVLLVSSMRALYNICDQLLYHPEQPETSRTHVGLPSTMNLPYEEVTLKTSDGVRLHSFLIKQEDNFESAPTILYLHGNAGNIGHRLAHAQGLFHTSKVNILLLEYRGYGRSEGTPSESGLYRDALAGMDFLLNHPGIDKRYIILFGRSLGGAVAVYVASHQKYSSQLAAVILENTFTSIPSLAKVIVPYKAIRYVPRIFYKSVFPSEDRISRICCPVLFVSGLADTLIPPSMMRKLHTKCPANFKRLVTFESGGHNQTWQCRDYFEICRDFVEEVKSAVDFNGGPESTVWPKDQLSVHVTADIL
ncbi:abhydrolase domain-containing protein 13-like [Tropilaelaps mercedesae]|uniref:Abhydrolase domain-containing protein 13-like n=1 Tax=Tropilaelaps mercedesae TaxID=418985 RepID=A0A1V9XU66_9ACAR|nr:abhydrolase domain-containing protein 13-like [Tropilaelaps mercedesae]